jgi:hypothetical protein
MKKSKASKKSKKSLALQALSHLREDVGEQRMGIKRDKSLMKKLKKGSRND